MSETIKLDLIKISIKSFAGKDKFKNVFNTAGYQQSVTKFFNLDEILSSKVAENHLEDCKNILKLYGGCHWILVN